MRNLDDSINYLRQIQKFFYEVNNGKLLKDKDIETYWLNKIRDELLLWNEDVVFEDINCIKSENGLGEYENPYLYSIIKNYVDAIDRIAEKVLVSRNIEKKAFPIWGTVNMFQFSAQIIVPNREADKIILISSGLMMYALYICKIVAKTFPIKKSDEGISLSYDKNLMILNVDRNSEIELRFMDLMLSYLSPGGLINVTPYLLKEVPPDIYSMMIYGFECFVVAHEYSHYLLGHMDKGVYSTRRFSKLEVEEIIYNWYDEMSADTLGIQLTVSVINETGINIWGLIGVFLCFKSFELFERLNTIYNIKGNDMMLFSETHPFAKHRISNLMKVVDNGVFADIIDAIDTLIDCLWYRMLKIFNELGIDLLLGNAKDVDFQKLQKMIYNFYFVDI